MSRVFFRWTKCISLLFSCLDGVCEDGFFFHARCLSDMIGVKVAGRRNPKLTSSFASRSRLSSFVEDNMEEYWRDMLVIGRSFYFLREKSHRLLPNQSLFNLQRCLSRRCDVPGLCVPTWQQSRSHWSWAAARYVPSHSKPLADCRYREYKHNRGRQRVVSAS
jgi:hypothetical protein